MHIEHSTSACSALWNKLVPPQIRTATDAVGGKRIRPSVPADSLPVSSQGSEEEGEKLTKYRSGKWGNKIQSQLRSMFVSSSRRDRMRRTKVIRSQNRLAEEPKRGGLDETIETSLPMILRRGKHDHWIKRQPWGVGQQFEIPRAGMCERCSHLWLPIG